MSGERREDFGDDPAGRAGPARPPAKQRKAWPLWVWVAALAVVGSLVLTGLLSAVLLPRADRPPDLEVSAQSLFDDYTHGNVAAADLKYKGKRLRVFGRVLGVNPAGSGYSVGVESGPNVFPGGKVLNAAIVATLPAASSADVAKFRDYDRVVIDGTFYGREDGPGRMGGMTLRLRDAVLVGYVLGPR